MPSIELVSVDAAYSESWGVYNNLNYVALRQLISGRGLFQKDLEQFCGVLLKLGKEVSLDGVSVEKSYELIDLDQVDADIKKYKHAQYVKLCASVLGDMKSLVALALQRSPLGQALFMCDYQLAGERKPDVRLGWLQFEELLCSGKVEFNRLYKIERDAVLTIDNSSEGVAM
jgi:hypothetical protein